MVGEPSSFSGEDRRTDIGSPGRRAGADPGDGRVGEPYVVDLMNGRLFTSTGCAVRTGGARELVPGHQGRPSRSPTSCSARSTRAASRR